MFEYGVSVALSVCARRRVVGSEVWRRVDHEVARVRVTCQVEVIRGSVGGWAVLAHGEGLGTARLGPPTW